MSGWVASDGHAWGRVPGGARLGAEGVALSFHTKCICGLKYCAFSALLNSNSDGGRVLVFCANKRGCDDLTRKLRLDGWPVMGTHGGTCHVERNWVLRVCPLPCKDISL